MPYMGWKTTMRMTGAERYSFNFWSWRYILPLAVSAKATRGFLGCSRISGTNVEITFCGSYINAQCCDFSSPLFYMVNQDVNTWTVFRPSETHQKITYVHSQVCLAYIVHYRDWEFGRRQEEFLIIIIISCGLGMGFRLPLAKGVVGF